MASRSKNRSERAELDRTFHGPEVLAELLQRTGSPLDVEEVAARMLEAQAGGDAASEVFPTFFEDEPRFADPQVARQLYENLFGLWDLLESGEDFKPGGEKTRPDRPRKVKRVPPVPPGKFSAEGPDAEWVDVAWRYLEGLDARGAEKLEHAFENRQDALVSFLDDERLTDEGYAFARHLLFELFAMLELGAPSGVGSADPESAKASLDDVPQALRDHAEEMLSEGELDEDAKLSAEDARRVREKVERGLAALWAVRKR